MMTTEDHRGLLNACRQAARKLHTVSGPAARSLVLELHDLLADPRTPPTRLSRVLDDARRIMTEAAQEVELERDERAFAMQRMADRVAAKKEAALDEAIREASEAFAKLFVLGMKIGRGEKKELAAADAEVDEAFKKAFDLARKNMRRH